MREKPHVTKEDIKQALGQLGIQENDIVMFHSSLSSMGYVEGGADTVIDAFLEKVGKNGTVVVPTLCQYDWEKMSREDIEKAWDMNRPSFVGLITETLRKRKESIRSDNPTHSVAAIGRYAEEITKGHKDAYGRDSPYRPKFASKGAFGIGSAWEKLYEYNAKYMFLGVDFDVCTMFHYVQAVLLEDYLKKIDKKAQWPEFNFKRMGRKLEELGLVKFGKIGEATTRLIESKKMVDVSLELLAGSEKYSAKKHSNR